MGGHNVLAVLLRNPDKDFGPSNTYPTTTEIGLLELTDNLM